MKRTQAQTQTIERLEKQIRALEFQERKAIEGYSPGTNLFALQNLLKKRRKELQDLKNFQWLAK